jgi:hypothetical protein
MHTNIYEPKKKKGVSGYFRLVLEAREKNDVAFSFTTALFLLYCVVRFFYLIQTTWSCHVRLRRVKLHPFVDKIQVLQLHVFLDGGSTIWNGGSRYLHMVITH